MQLAAPVHDQTTHGPRVLVVDDDREMLGLFATFLELAGFEVTTVDNGIDALRVAVLGFDAVTTDLAMPRMDGLEFIERLRALPIPLIPVVLVTAQPLGEFTAESIGSCCILSKPCNLEDLAHTLRSLLTCSHSRFSCSSCPRSPGGPTS